MDPAVSLPDSQINVCQSVDDEAQCPGSVEEVKQDPTDGEKHGKKHKALGQGAVRIHLATIT